MTGDALARAAAALVGSPFRLHGRNPATGLDCVGVLAAALAAIGSEASLPSGYPLRLRGLRGWLPDPAGLGFAPATGPAEAGDTVLFALSAIQPHLAIAGSGGGWIHAHAGLRRVVHQPEPPGADILHHWRLAPHNRERPWQP